MKFIVQFLPVLFILTIWADPISPEKNKYSKEANVKYKELDNPFRMAKLNAVWHKAQKNLSEGKLQSLYNDLKLQDKEELQLKRLKSEGNDKDGLMEAEVRRKFKGILNTYGLLEYFDDGHQPEKATRDGDNRIHKSLFKDKKLNKLWEKAEKVGFTEKELKTLKEEFSHHQDKLDDYYMLMESLTNEEKKLMKNDLHDIDTLLEDSDEPSERGKKKQDSKLNQIRDKHQEIKASIDTLHKKTSSGPNAADFNEPRVQTLWSIALKADFTSDELSSLRTELKHYEKRLEKLQQLHGEFSLKSEFKAKDGHLHTDKDQNSMYADKIKRQERTVEKLHLDLEQRIMKRHTEL